jgi:hypothetical protein
MAPRHACVICAPALVLVVTGGEVDVRVLAPRGGDTAAEGSPLFGAGDERQEGSGLGDEAPLSTRESLRRVLRREESPPDPRAARKSASTASAQTNSTNPRSGTGLQQARTPCVEKAVEVVRNREDGTRRRGWLLRPDRPSSEDLGVDTRERVGGGANTKTIPRKEGTTD